MNRRTALMAIPTVGLGSAGVVYYDIDQSDIPVLNDPDVESVKENAETVPYDELYRNVSEYKGEPVTYSNVEITDIPESKDGYQEFILRLKTADARNGHYLYGLWNGDPFREDDMVELWGTVNGTKTYLTLTGEKTVVEVDLVDMKLINNSN
ncbi:hypothetical protein [Natrinema caseinilyticum]|uniref:hypothetical protein n=1 Tax=Natrinema caseinilyticum TaxID=2961570 RepID=UPI0020C3736A|nr:hypothetical protein [Natrinema caseinilyticum]